MQEQIVNPRNGDVITVSTTWLYYRKAVKGVYHWFPYTLEKHDMLKTLKLALQGDISALESSVFENTFIRFGWLDKGLKDLRWISLKDALIAHKEKTLQKSVKTKLDHICRLLFISVKDIRHADDVKFVAPRTAKNKTFSLRC